MNSPSPLVPQGAIPPKTTSRPQRVLMIAAMVVGLHVAGLSLVLFQGCGKDGGTQLAGSADTNTAAMSYPVSADTNPPSSMFASATNMPGSALAAQTNNPYAPPAPGSFGAPTPAAPAFAGVATDPGVAVAPTEPAAPAGPQKDYIVQRRDTLSAISAKQGVSLSAIMRSNPNLDPKKLQVGQTIKIPIGAGPTAAVGTASMPPTSTAPGVASAAGRTYKVKPGDTLTRIAKAHGITVNQLRAANNMKTTQVQAGKTLKIPAGGQRTAAAPADPNTN